MTGPGWRNLTDAEIEAFDGDASVNVAIESGGVEYYGDACADYDGEVAQFIVDDDGYYVEVK